MRQLAERQKKVNQDYVALTDDGELHGFVFCLHCHTVNLSETVLCASCKRPLVEPPSDLRDRLDRIAQHNNHREPESVVDHLFQRSEDFSDGILQTLQRIPTGIGQNIGRFITNKIHITLGNLRVRRYIRQHLALIVFIGMELTVIFLLLVEFVTRHMR